jgi:type IV pilus assembly protein PilE
MLWHDSINQKRVLKMNTSKVTQKGYTLVEIMIIVAIVGILASIALPNYQNYVRKSRATEATSVLADMRVKMEQYFQDRRTYVGGPCAAPAGTNTTFFAYSCAGGDGTATTYTLQATGSGQMAAYSYTVNQANAKTSTTYDGGGNCWTTGASC